MVAIDGLTLRTLGKIFSGRNIEDSFFFFSGNRIGYFMQIVFIRDDSHEMSNPVFLEKSEKISSICRMLNMSKEW